MLEMHRNTGSATGEASATGERASRRATFDIDDPDVRRKRAVLYAGLVNTDELMAIMRKSKRSIARLIQHGMPHTQLFGENLFDLEAVKIWVSEQAKASRRPAARGRGRPRIYPPR
jgi:hypothetical protein